VIAAVDERHGQEAVDQVYTALGQHVHERDEELSTSVISAALADAGLSDDLLSAVPQFSELKRACNPTLSPPPRAAGSVPVDGSPLRLRRPRW